MGSIMVKFLKLVLFIIIIAFAFALGVRFSDSFKNNVGNLKEDELRIETEMDKAFDNLKNDVRDDTSIDAETSLTEAEKDEVNNTSDAMPDYIDIEIPEPMDGVIDDTGSKSAVHSNSLNSQDSNALPTTQNYGSGAVEQHQNGTAVQQEQTGTEPSFNGIEKSVQQNLDPVDSQPIQGPATTTIENFPEPTPMQNTNQNQMREPANYTLQK